MNFDCMYNSIFILVINLYPAVLGALPLLPLVISFEELGGDVALLCTEDGLSPFACAGRTHRQETQNFRCIRPSLPRA